MSDEGRRNGGEGGEDGGKQAPGETGTKAPATVLGAIVSSAVERLQAALQPSPDGSGPNTQNVQLWLARVLESMSETRKRKEAEAAAAESATSGAPSAAADEGGEVGEDESSNVVDLAQVRDAKRSQRPSVDVRAVVEHSVAQFVRERLSEEGGEEVPPEVTIDGEFVARHGADLLRVVMGSVGQAWLGVLSGALPESVSEAMKTARKGDESGEKPPASSQTESDEEGSAAAPQVHYDVLNIVAGLLRPPAKGSEAAARPSSDEDEDEDA